MKNLKKLIEIVMYTVQLYSVKSRRQAPSKPRASQHFLNQLIFHNVVIQISLTQTSV